MIGWSRPIANHVHNSMDYFQYLPRIGFVPSIDYNLNHCWPHSQEPASDYFVEDYDVVQPAPVMVAIRDVFFQVHFE